MTVQAQIKIHVMGVSGTVGVRLTEGGISGSIGGGRAGISEHRRSLWHLSATHTHTHTHSRVPCLCVTLLSSFVTASCVCFSSFICSPLCVWEGSDLLTLACCPLILSSVCGVAPRTDAESRAKEKRPLSFLLSSRLWVVWLCTHNQEK